jgi:DNA-binding protein HU-beta
MINKKELAKIIAAKRRTTNSEELENINALFETIEELLDEGKDVNIVGFGCFSCVEREPRKVVNPKTSEILEIGKRVTLKFVQGKHLKDIFKNKRS